MFKLQGKTIYIICPAGVKTGGPELLHQLGKRLLEMGCDVKMAYVYKWRHLPYIVPEFEKYQVPYVDFIQIQDKEENLLIIPEIYLPESMLCKHIQKVIWWLSVDAFTAYASLKEAYRNYSGKRFFLRAVRRFTNPTRCAKKVKYHMCQSYYAIDYVKRLGVEEERIAYLSDYLNDAYLDVDPASTKTVSARRDFILYNPRKGAAFTQKLREYAPELEWKPIRNMTTEEVHQCMLSSKVYIDFGNHPGKDRIPREAAISGCCVITGRDGSAAFEQDVPIQASYKFDAIDENIPGIIECIKTCLKDYDTEIQKFTAYCDMIKGEKQYFEQCVEEIFG